MTVKMDWSMQARWVTLDHVFEVRSAFGGAVMSESRERQTAASQMLIACSPPRSSFDSTSLVFLALEPMKNCNDSQILPRAKI